MTPPPKSDKFEKICLEETKESVTSISTIEFVPQPLENKSHYIQNRLFVGGFPADTTSKDLSSVFRKFGEIIGCNVRHEDKSKHYGFVTFKNIASAEEVLKIAGKTNDFYIRGYALKIRRAVFKPKKSGLILPAVQSFSYKGKKVLTRYHKGTAYFEVLNEDDNCVGHTTYQQPVLLPNPVPQMIQAPAVQQYPSVPFLSPLLRLLPAPPMVMPQVIQSQQVAIRSAVVQMLPSDPTPPPPYFAPSQIRWAPCLDANCPYYNHNNVMNSVQAQ